MKVKAWRKATAADVSILWIYQQIVLGKTAPSPFSGSRISTRASTPFDKSRSKEFDNSPSQQTDSCAFVSNQSDTRHVETNPVDTNSNELETIPDEIQTFQDEERL